MTRWMRWMLVVVVVVLQVEASLHHSDGRWLLLSW